MRDILRPEQRGKLASLNGYKFLGWQNGWHHVYFDKEHNVVDYHDPKSYSFGYLEADYPEYGACRRLEHKTVNIQHTATGSEHTVICDTCKIYWKYDSSD